jgi:hypothetical protein
LIKRELFDPNQLQKNTVKYIAISNEVVAGDTHHEGELKHLVGPMARLDASPWVHRSLMIAGGALLAYAASQVVVAIATSHQPSSDATTGARMVPVAGHPTLVPRGS